MIAPKTLEKIAELNAAIEAIDGLSFVVSGVNLVVSMHTNAYATMVVASFGSYDEAAGYASLLNEGLELGKKQTIRQLEVVETELLGIKKQEPRLISKPMQLKKDATNN